MPLYIEITRCRACQSERLMEVLDLGEYFVSDFLASPADHVDRAPLALLRCDDCSLVQLRHTVDRARLYASYWYRSATQPAMVQALQDVVRDATGRVPLEPGDLVMDIGANDGTLLAQYPGSVHKLAYEPATNLWPDLTLAGARIVGGFFPPKLLGGMPRTGYVKPKIITSVACFYDVPDPRSFCSAIQANLAPGGVWINQLAYLPMTLVSNNFGDFVHEHLTYWTIRAFDNLLASCALTIIEHSLNDVNGGSIRFVVGHGTERTPIQDDHLDQFFFLQKHMDDGKRRLRMLLRSLKRAGKTVVGYGASTKGATYLQYWELGPDLLPTIADRNPDKWGKFTPTGQQVISEEQMREHRPDYLLVLPFHFLDAFLEREKDLTAAGTQWLVPFPDLHILGGEQCQPLPLAVA